LAALVVENITRGAALQWSCGRVIGVMAIASTWARRLGQTEGWVQTLVELEHEIADALLNGAVVRRIRGAAWALSVAVCRGVGWPKRLGLVGLSGLGFLSVEVIDEFMGSVSIFNGQFEFPIFILEDDGMALHPTDHVEPGAGLPAQARERSQNSRTGRGSGTLPDCIPKALDFAQRYAMMRTGLDLGFAPRAYLCGEPTHPTKLLPDGIACSPLGRPR
jgi:hypothetical protein